MSNGAIVTMKTLERLPEIESLRRLLQSLAMLDAIIMPEWQYRYYSFNALWSEKEMMASMRDGTGDNYFILFSDAGVVIKGFERYSPLGSFIEKTGKPYPGIFAGMPELLTPFLSEPAFEVQQTTFGIWRLTSASSWCGGQIDWSTLDAAASELELLNIVVGGPEYYKTWAEEYYERNVPIETIRQIFSFLPLKAEMVCSLNPDITLPELQDDIKEIGYPVAAEV